MQWAGGQGPNGPGLTLPLTSSLCPQSTLFCQVERLMELEGQGWGEAGLVPKSLTQSVSFQKV